MNYLAHLILAEREEGSVIGNLMGDFRKYVKDGNLPVAVRSGIENHQRVDKYTDNHPAVYELKRLFSRNRRRFAGLILDLTFDHFLSVHWDRYSMEPREDFIDYCYSCLDRGLDLMPDRMQKTVCLMIREDWLGSYEQLAGIDVAINRLSGRIRFENKLDGAIEEVKSNYEIIEKGFHTFFPLLKEHVSLNA